MGNKHAIYVLSNAASVPNWADPDSCELLGSKQHSPNADAGDKTKLWGKPGNANDMQEINQSRHGKRCESVENDAWCGKRCKARKTMQDTENEPKARCKTKTRVRQHA